MTMTTNGFADQTANDEYNDARDYDPDDNYTVTMNDAGSFAVWCRITREAVTHWYNSPDAAIAEFNDLTRSR